MSVSAVIRAVLEQHPLEAGKDHYAGQIICGGCHLCLGNPTSHLIKALVAALDPVSVAPTEPVVDRPRSDPRESQIDWVTGPDTAGAA